MSRVAAVDCGTNSLRLLIADRDRTTLRDVVRRMEIVRLGQGVDRTGRLAPEALERTFAVLRDYAADIERHGVQRTRMVATSATRDATNRELFVSGVTEILGISPEVVTGAEEAALSFLGATRDLAGGPAAPPYLVVDIGGGSTEFVLGGDAETDPGQVIASLSVDVGCVRLTERHLRDDPPSADHIAAAAADIDAALDRVRDRVPVHRAGSLVGVAGTVTTIAGIALGLPAYDPVAIHHSVLDREAVGRVTEALLTTGHAGRAAIPVMHPGRVDVIAAGALTLHRTMHRFGMAEVVVSEHDILDGIAWSML